MTLDELGRADAVTLSDRGFLQLDADLGSGAEPVTLVTLLSAGRAPATATVEVEATDHLVVVVDWRRYVINRTPGEEVVVGELRTDARLFASAADALLIVGATRATRQGERLLSADATVSVLVDGEGRVSVSTLEASRVELALDREPTAVRVNGTATDRWTYDPASGLSVTLTDPSR